jgi:hypothetical protein
MKEILKDSWAEETDKLWMAGSTGYPRIAVVAKTRLAALALLEERRQWWLNLPPAGDQ